MKKTYFAWMLRIIQVGSGKNRAWRASLEDPHTRKRVGFDSTKALYEYIQHCIDNPEPNPDEKLQTETSDSTSTNLREIPK